MSDQNIKIEATEEQLLYAGILEKGMLVGLVLMFITFGLYMTGIMPSVIPSTSGSRVSCAFFVEIEN